MRTVGWIFGAVTALTACASQPAAEPVAAPQAAVDPASPLLAANYLPTAASGDQFEIQSSQLALQMSQNQSVRSFAQILITDHTTMSNQLMTAAQGAGLTPPPPMLLPQHQQMLDSLRAAGPGFEMAFRDAQVAAHQQALDLHQNYAGGGDVPALRTTAAQAVPIIQAHLSQAQALPVVAPPPPPAPTSERG